MSREPRESWLTYAIVNLLLLAPGGFFVWMTVVAQDSGLEEFTFILGLMGGGLLIWAFIAIGERRSNR